MYGFATRSPGVVFAVAAALSLAVGVGILYVPPLAVERMRLGLFYAPGYLAYATVHGRDFRGGDSVSDLSLVLGGTAVGWGAVVAFLWWLRDRFGSALSFAFAVAAAVAALVFLFSVAAATR